MKSVTQRIKEIKQPIGGYLNPKLFLKTELKDFVELKEENVNAAIIGLTVDYLSRYINSADKEEAFKISLLGARIIDDEERAYKLLNEINGLDNKSITNACKLCGYDVCYRAGSEYYKNIDDINPDEDTIFNIKTMVKRAVYFFEQYGPVIQDGITFAGGYTETIVAGDADFITEDTLWDFKVSKNEPTKDHTLQLIIYYLLGLHSYQCDFSNIKKIGLFNPRKNVVYEYEIKNIDIEIIKLIEEDVIGYNKNNNQNKTSNKFTVTDIMAIMGCSRHIVMKYYAEDGLPLFKEKNKYVIYKGKFYDWLEQRERKIEEEQKEHIIKICIFIFSILVIVLLFIFNRTGFKI